MVILYHTSYYEHSWFCNTAGFATQLVLQHRNKNAGLIMDGYRKTVLYVGLLGLYTIIHHISNTSDFATHLVSQHRNQKAGFATLLRETVLRVTVSGSKSKGKDVTWHCVALL